MPLSNDCYTSLKSIRFLRIYNQQNNTVFLPLYFSHKNKMDNFYCICYDMITNTRFLLENEQIIWKD